MNKEKIVIALAGNPNSGKTTIFNALTGARQHVGNYSGVTVESKEGTANYKGQEIRVIDLPGTYGLTAYSPDELVARQVIIEEEPDIVVNIADASNLERSLYLTAQLKELETPLILVLNVADIAEKNQITIDYQLLSQLLGLPVIRAIGSQNVGIDQLLEAVVSYKPVKGESLERPVRYRPEVEEELARMQEAFGGGCLYELPRSGSEGKGPVSQDKAQGGGGKAQGSESVKLPLRWLMVKLLEKDREVIGQVLQATGGQKLLDEAESSAARLKKSMGNDSEMLLVEDRYAFVRGICREASQKGLQQRVSLTERIDNIILNRAIGIPLFLGLMWLLFQLTFTLGTPPMDWIDAGVSWLGEWISENMDESLLRSLLVDGIIGGVGGVIIFLPNILLLFLGIALLEGTGYMARAAFVMDKIMHRAGLHGKSFIPMLIGFGCSVPAIMATRTLENPRDRLVTMLVTPLMSCGARLPVYTLLIAAFFPAENAGNVLFSIYMLGILMAILMARVFRTWLLPGEAEPFVMELPLYRMPSLKSVLLHMWERTWLYLKKAGTIILAFSVLMWGLFTFPMTDSQGQEYESPAVQMENSYAGKIGHAVAPLVKPLGFDWKTGVALMAGFGAKEVVVSTMGTLYSIEDEEALAEEEETAVEGFAARAREQSGYTPLVAYVLMIFTLLYVPCMAVVAVIKRETNSWKWPLFTVVYTTALAWTVSFVVYRAGLLLGIGV